MKATTLLIEVFSLDQQCWHHLEAFGNEDTQARLQILESKTVVQQYRQMIPRHIQFEKH